MLSCVNDKIANQQKYWLILKGSDDSVVTALVGEFRESVNDYSYDLNCSLGCFGLPKV